MAALLLLLPLPLRPRRQRSPRLRRWMPLMEAWTCSAAEAGGAETTKRSLLLRLRYSLMCNGA
ncbi:hypothetical protein EON64_08015 [archaeon]|nr:MAG: hypothetical protein EON64_08015 [archaeon]